MEKGLAIVASCGLGAIVLAFWFGFRLPTAEAVPVNLTTNTLDAWGWSGMPIDQDGIAGIEGVETISLFGFLHLNCKSSLVQPFCDTVANKYPNIQVDVATGAVTGWAWLGTDDTTAGTPHSIGWVDFNPDPLPTAAYADPACVGLGPAFYFPAEPCHAARIDTGNQEELSGWARIPSLAEAGDEELGTSNLNNDWGWVLLRGENSADGDDFGVLYRNGTFEGWAYSGGGTLADASYENAVGLGWLDFSTSSGGSPGGPSGGYLSTERGDVYVQGGVSNPAGTLSPTQYNATFLIFSSGGTGSVVNFSSQLLGANNFVDESADVVTLPDADSEFRSELGRIDFEKLTTITSGTENVYGDTVQTVSSLAGFSGSEFLDGKVYVVDNGSGCCAQSHAISSSVTFTNGTASSSSGSNFDGSGTIIVNGDLRIDANTFYNNTALIDVENLANVAWIIRGDLTIGENVTNLVGNFFVLGDDTIGDGVNDGLITTESTNTAQLIVYGLMMARAYDLQRTYEGIPGEDEPAELIYYDGRIIANPPPGLRDFTSTLPLLGENEVCIFAPC